MYEQQSHSLLNQTLDKMEPELRLHDLRHFYTRLGANFYAIYTLFHRLYGQREDYESQLVTLVNVLARQYLEREDELKQRDM